MKKVMGIYSSYQNGLFSEISIFRHDIEECVDNAISSTGVEETPYRWVFGSQDEIETVMAVLSMIDRELVIEEVDANVFRDKLTESFAIMDKDVEY